MKKSNVQPTHDSITNVISTPQYTYVLELRKRLLLCALSFVLCLIPLLFYSRELYTLVATPLLQSLPLTGKLIATNVFTPLTTPLKLSAVASLVLSLPFLLYHLWAFIAPALYKSEKNLLFPLLGLSITLFYTGMAFAYFVVCPLALAFFIHIAPIGVTVMTDITHYLDFVLTLAFAFGAAFQIPIITFILCRLGIVSVESLKQKRPIVIVGAFVLGMLLTPPDVVSQVLLALPLWGLFECGLWLTTKILKSRAISSSDAP